MWLAGWLEAAGVSCVTACFVQDGLGHTPYGNQTACAVLRPAVCAPPVAELLLCLCQLLLRECQLPVDLGLRAPHVGQLKGQARNLR
jgi:hypothetical protein